MKKKSSSQEINWSDYEQLMTSEVSAIAAKEIKSNPQKKYYAGAFYCFYRDNTVMRLPLFSLNSESEIQPEADKWSAADFGFHANLFENPRLQAAMMEIEAIYRDGSDANAKAIEKAFFKSMIQVTKAIRQSLQRQGLVDDNFIVFFQDEDEEVELIIKCVGKQLLKKVAPEMFEEDEHDALLRRIKKEESEIAKLPPSEQYIRYAAKIEWFVNELIAVGQPAFDAVLERLLQGNEDERRCARHIFAYARIPDPKVLEALRTLAREKPGSYYSSALGQLGDFEFLLGLLDNPKTRNEGLSGLCTLPSPLTYRGVELLLKKEPRALESRKLEQYYNCHYNKEDVPAAIEGLASPHVEIRRNAVFVLWNRSYGASLGKKILPLLVSMFHDEDSEVRRKAVYGMTYWKKSALPYIPEMRKLFSDKVKDVQDAAKSSVEELARYEK